MRNYVPVNWLRGMRIALIVLWCLVMNNIFLTLLGYSVFLVHTSFKELVIMSLVALAVLFIAIKVWLHFHKISKEEKRKEKEAKKLAAQNAKALAKEQEKQRKQTAKMLKKMKR